MCDDEEVVYIDGEQKYVTFTVNSTSRCMAEAMVITEASYILKNKQTRETVSSGKCEIDGRKVRMLLNPPPGSYVLTLSVTIPPETIKHQVYVYVKK